jgi:hypothetical protein
VIPVLGMTKQLLARWYQRFTSHPSCPTSKAGGDPVRKGAKDGAPELLRLAEDGSQASGPRIAV